MRSPSFWSAYGVDKGGSKKIGILIEDTGWGVPAIEDLKAALKTRNLEPVSVDKMKVGDAISPRRCCAPRIAEAETILTIRQHGPRWPTPLRPATRSATSPR